MRNDLKNGMKQGVTAGYAKRRWLVLAGLLGLLLLLGVGLLLGARGLGLAQGEWLSFAQLQARHSEWVAWYGAWPWGVRAGFFLLYLGVAALSLPGAALLALAGGAVLGLGWGVVLVSFASSMGALLAFWMARYVLRDWVQRRFAARLVAVNQGIEREGALYLLSLRLIPVVPFFVVNLVMGLTPMRSRTFYGVSQLGMLAGTAIYVNAGTQLAQLRSMGDIWSPALLGSLALLGALPWLARRWLLLGTHWMARQSGNKRA